jgi:hypothetical protein
VNLLNKQAQIGPGQKALVFNQTLYHDWVYASTGDMGRWLMNTFVRDNQVVSMRKDVCMHIEWLVAEVDRGSDVFCGSKQQQVLLEIQIKQLLATISNLMNTYESDRTVGDIQGARCRLQECMVRLLCSTTRIFSGHVIVHDDTEVHV